jgi:branched-chain amino acid transport system ATP-binding protein
MNDSPTVSTEPLLKVANLKTGYGDLTAVWDLSLTVNPGTVTLLVGRNGAGKTTTLMSVAGLLPVFAGKVDYFGENLTSMSVRERVRAGISFVPEGKRVFPTLTVEDNLLVGGVLLGKRRRKEHLAMVYDRFPLLAEFRSRRGAALSGGQQQVLAIGQALMTSTKLLILDEPSAGLAPKIFADVLDAVRGLAQDGVGILLVEQVIEVAVPVADRVVIMERGRSVYHTDSKNGDDVLTVIHEHLRGPAELTI